MFNVSTLKRFRFHLVVIRRVTAAYAASYIVSHKGQSLFEIHKHTCARAQMTQRSRSTMANDGNFYFHFSQLLYHTNLYIYISLRCHCAQEPNSICYYIIAAKAAEVHTRVHCFQFRTWFQRVYPMWFNISWRTSSEMKILSLKSTRNAMHRHTKKAAPTAWRHVMILHVRRIGVWKEMFRCRHRTWSCRCSTYRVFRLRFLTNRSMV